MHPRQMMAIGGCCRAYSVACWWDVLYWPTNYASDLLSTISPQAPVTIIPFHGSRTHPRRTMDAAVMGTSVEMGSVSPGVALVGEAVMVGRVAAVPSAFSRYGGVKICPSRWLTLQPATIVGMSSSLHSSQTTDTLSTVRKQLRVCAVSPQALR